MRRKHLLAALLACMPIVGYAQDTRETYFPIGIQSYQEGTYRSGNPEAELRILDSLRINQIMDCDSSDYHVICGPRAGKTTIRMVSYGGPEYQDTGTVYKHTLWHGKICPFDSIYNTAIDSCGWAMMWPVDHDSHSWRDTVQEYMRDIKVHYATTTCWDSMIWYGMYMDEYKQRLTFWSERDWGIVFDTIMSYARDCWDSLGIPENYSMIYSSSLAPFYKGPLSETYGMDISTLKRYLESIGVTILDADFFPYLRDWPRRNSINDSFFYYHQENESPFEMVRHYDSCWFYFERPVTSRIQWTALNQACKQDSGNKWRWPAREEVRLQGWLALSRGAKGLRYFNYGSQAEGNHLWDTLAVYGLLYYQGTSGIRRTPRSKYASHFNPDFPNDYSSTDFDDSADHRIFDWVKEFNDEALKIGTVLTKLRCVKPFNVIHTANPYRERPDTAVIPDSSYIRSVYATDAVYHAHDYFEVSLFKFRETSNDTDLFMVVNRYNRQEDSVIVNVKLNYRYPYRLYDVSTRTMHPGQLPSRDTIMYDTLKIMPGGGRFMKVVWDVQAPYYTLAQNVSNTAFKEFYSEGDVKATGCTIKDASNVRLTSEDGSVTLDTGFTVESGSTLLARVVPKIPEYYSDAQGQALSSGRIRNHATAPAEGSADIDPNLPKVYALAQNFPNPAGRNTTIKYQLPKSSPVRLRVYNIAGQLVEQRDLGTQAPGYYSVKWDASGVANGVYLYKLNAGSFQSVKKMTVLK